ncbi:M1 family metallopeptidase [Seonamhaeicola sediminis]|uniref:M1 family metallopeptidase n=1 Tax=Seonamhaeicola sediminis TaxID=2528206 RepID=A0A562YE03_9FLAO|nr:metalloprotease [Seonamhaeicola sediminis]TWO32820.1 M1 family metallopeptidase [Seonamhaeicola sediminis]
MNYRLINCLIFSLICFYSFGQNKIDLRAIFDIENKKITISQTIQYQNTSQDELQIIYLNNWANSYATKNTPLAQRIADEYINDFHLAKNEDRGYSIVTSIKHNNEDVQYCELENHPDVIKVTLNKPLKPGDSYSLSLENIVQIPTAKFTKYGITDIGNLNLRYWYITPAIYNGQWQYYSNKDLDDLYIPIADLNFEISFPNGYYITSELNSRIHTQNSKSQTISLYGLNRRSTKLFLSKTKDFETIQNENLALVSSIDDEGLEVIDKVLITEKVLEFINKNIGSYPHERLLISQVDYDKAPIYGLNFLPKFIKPYPNHFQYELKILKIALHNHLENTLLINPRKEQWLIDAVQIYFAMKYVDEHYPNMKFLGTIADIWGVRSFHIADMKFNDKYSLAFMLMARTNRDQKLTMAKDSLLKFNANISSKYKAGVGLSYLDDFINHDIVESSLTTFLKNTKLKETSTRAFESYIKSKTNKNIDWFFNDFINTRKKIDFKIGKVVKTEDSVTLTIKNKRDNSMPISLYSLKDDSIISKTWIENITDRKTITIPRNEANKLVLNYNKVIPEINIRDNWKSLKGFFFNNKPFQFRVFQDIEDPHYNQVFLMPVAEFNNIYDGLTLGTRIYNRTVLRKLFNYRIEPQYALNSKTLTGSGFVSNTHYFNNSDLFNLTYGIAAGYSSYAEDLFVRQVTPSITFSFRNDNDFRSNERQFLRFRYIDIKRDKDENNILTSSEPNYAIFNARYVYSNDNLINFKKWYVDFQLAKNFSKIGFNYEYRKLFESNRQINLRVFTGAFLKNNTDLNSNYFSFALDRPTDYLFDYAYLGRSESTGIFSQQFITAEGGFKSKLDFPFANQWISTLNASTTLWQYILAYGDIGLVKNKFDSAHFVYDSGIRLNLVTDYFEIYFPIYSNLGWEIGQPNYDQKIRFKFTADPEVLLGLFRRRWF